MGLKLARVEGSRNLKRHERNAIREIQDRAPWPGYIVPSVVVYNSENREIDALLLFRSMFVLVELKHTWASKVQVDSLNTRMWFHFDNLPPKPRPNPFHGLSRAAKIFHSQLASYDLNLPIKGVVVFDDRIQELVIQERVIGRDEYASMGGIAGCRICAIRSAIEGLAAPLEGTWLGKAELDEALDVIRGVVRPAEEAPKQVGSFVVEEVMATQGKEEFILMAGHQQHTDRPVWLKKYEIDFFAPNTDRDIEILVRDAVALDRLAPHPNLLTFVDIVPDEDCMYVVFRREEGRFLRDHMNADDLSMVSRLHILNDLLAGLAHIHSHQEGGRTALYRDLRPESVFVTADGQAKLFNLDCSRLPGKQTAIKRAARRAHDWQNYASPELLGRKTDDVDTPADIYSWGVTAYELLTGQLPYAHERDLYAGKFTPLATFSLSLPQTLEQLIEQAIVEDTAKRPTLEALHPALQEALHGIESNT